MQWLYVYYPLSIESKVYACVRNIGIEANVAIYGYSSEFVYKLVNHCIKDYQWVNLCMYNVSPGYEDILPMYKNLMHALQ